MNASKQSAAQPAAQKEAAPAPAPAMGALAIAGKQLGNAGLRRLLQAKLTVSQPQDHYEQEADRVAEQVMRMPEPQGVARSPLQIQRASEPEGGAPTVDAKFESSLHDLGTGEPLAGSMRSFMEPRFNADFSGVRIHTGSQAQSLARSVSAQAFTVGSNVVFGEGHYAPETERGKRLLAHELTHVVQQTGPGQRRVSRQPDLLGAERKPSVEDWLRGSRNLSRVEMDELEQGIDMLVQHQGFQNHSTLNDFAIEQTLQSLRAEVNRRKKASERKSGRARKPSKTAGAAPETHPRVLMEKAVEYADVAEQRREYDLIMRWLPRDELSPKERKRLQSERDYLHMLLLTERQRLATERRANKIKTALTPEAGGEAGGLVSMARTIEGIGMEPGIPDIRYIYYRGERYAISAEQARQLRNRLASELKHVVNRIESDAGMELDRYHMQVEINREHVFASFWSGVLGGVEDPGGKISKTFAEVMWAYKDANADLKAGKLEQAAARVPQLEQLTRELRRMSRGFQDGYIEGAERAVAGLEFTRDAAFAVAGSIAAVVAAPLVAGFVGGLGVSGAAGAALTTLGTAGLVGGGMATLRGGTAAAATALAGGSLRDVGKAALSEGMRGFREGVISGAGGAAARAIAPFLGVGTNAGMQIVRRAAGEAIVNGTTSMIDALWQGKSIKEAAAAGALGALTSVPGAAVGGLNSRAAKFLLAPMTAAATAYAGAVLSGEPADVALARAGAAMATSLSMSAASHGGERDAALVNRGKAAGTRVKAAAVAAKKRIAEKIELHKQGLSDPRKLGIEDVPADTRPDKTPAPEEPYTPQEVEITIPPPGQEPPGPQEIHTLTGPNVTLAPVDESGLGPPKTTAHGGHGPGDAAPAGSVLVPTIYDEKPGTVVQGFARNDATPKQPKDPVKVRGFQPPERDDSTAPTNQYTAVTHKKPAQGDVDMDPDATRRSDGDFQPGGARSDQPPPAQVIDDFRKPIFVPENQLGEGAFKFAYKGEEVVILVPKDPGNWRQIDAQLKMLTRLRTRDNGVLKRYIAKALGPFSIQGRYAMVMPRYGEGSRSIVEPDGQGGWLFAEPSKYLNETSIRDLRRIQRLLHKHKIQIWDQQYLIDTDGHVYLADPSNVVDGVPLPGYDTQCQMLIEAAEANIARRRNQPTVFVRKRKKQ